MSRATDPAALLAELYDRDVRRVLLEGGPTLAAAFLRAGLVDEVVLHLAPKLLGAGPSLVGDLGITTIADALTLRIVDVTRLGGDVQIRLRPTRHTGGGSPRTEGAEVFTGIVEEVGTLVVREDQARRRGPADPRRARCSRAWPSATRSPSTASA